MVKPRSIHKTSSKLLMAIWGFQTAFGIWPHVLGLMNYMILYDHYMQQNPTFLPTPKTTSTHRFFLIWHLSPIPTAPAGEHGGALGVALWPRCLRFARGPGSWLSQKTERWWLGNQRLGKNCIEKMRDFLFEQQKWGLKQEKWNVGHQKQELYSKNGGLKQNSSSTAENWPSLREHSNEAIPNLSAVHIPILLAWCSITIPPILLVVINPDVLSTPKNPHVTPCPHD